VIPLDGEPGSHPDFDEGSQTIVPRHDLTPHNIGESGLRRAPPLVPTSWGINVEVVKASDDVGRIARQVNQDFRGLVCVFFVVEGVVGIPKAKGRSESPYYANIISNRPENSLSDIWRAR
jgi:hypothetical protein